MISWEDKLGVRPADKAKLFVVFSPVGPYYPAGFKPIKLYTETKRIRAAPGGTGNMKVGGNYAPTIPLSQKAEQMGFNQVLWLWQDRYKWKELADWLLTDYFPFKQRARSWYFQYLLLLDQRRWWEGAHNSLPQWGHHPSRYHERLYPRKSFLHSLCYIFHLTITWFPSLIGTNSRVQGVQGYRTKTQHWRSHQGFKGRKSNDEREAINLSPCLNNWFVLKILEAFGSGTAVVVCPIEQFTIDGETYKIPINPKLAAGELTYRISTLIQNIQVINHSLARATSIKYSIIYFIC